MSDFNVKFIKLHHSSYICSLSIYIAHILLVVSRTGVLGEEMF